MSVTTLPRSLRCPVCQCPLEGHWAWCPRNPKVIWHPQSPSIPVKEEKAVEKLAQEINRASCSPEFRRFFIEHDRQAARRIVQAQERKGVVRRCEYCKQRRVSVKRLRLFNNEDDAVAGRNGCYRTICKACADNLEGG